MKRYILTKLSRRYPVSYRRYIKSRKWKKKAIKIRCRDKHKCRDCGERGWEVHHLTYDRLGFELDSDLVTLCRDCHGAIHGK